MRLSKRNTSSIYLVEGGVLFELKACQRLHDAHRAQTLNYLFLTGLQRAKLLNFGMDDVQQMFVSTRITSRDRKLLTIDTTRWMGMGSESARFHDFLLQLLDDWGAFLQLSLYSDAIADYFSDPQSCIRKVPVLRNGIPVSSQLLPLLDPETGFKLTAASGSLEVIERGVRRILRVTPLRTIQWVNLHHHEITFVTLRKES